MARIKIYTNESVNVAIPEGLRRRGIEAWSAKDAGNLGLTDEAQLAYAVRQGATIFTHDDDFFQLAVQWIKEGRSHCGVIYAHQQEVTIGECISKIRFIVDLLAPQDMKDHIEFL